MTRATGQILSGILTVSGLIHISGLLTAWEYDLYAGIILVIIGGVWLLNDYFKHNKSFSTKHNLIIEKTSYKWWRAKEIIVTLLLTFLLIYNNEQLPESILVTLIFYFSFMVILDHRGTVEISEKYIAIDGMRIPFHSIRLFDLREDKIIIIQEQDLTPELQVKIDFFDIKKKDRQILIERLTRR